MVRDTWRRIGECGVDSGQLYIIDPCYLRRWEHERDYQDCMDVMFERPQRGGEVFDGVVFGTAHGDGVYPIFARYDQGAICEVRIFLDGGPYPDGSDD